MHYKMMKMMMIYNWKYWTDKTKNTLYKYYSYSTSLSNQKIKDIIQQKPLVASSLQNIG